jgi:hypothetical protein
MCKHFQVFSRVIGSISIDMMYVLIGGQPTTELYRGNMSMVVNFALAISEWMRSIQKVDVASSFVDTQSPP